MLVHAPAKLNLCLYLGARRDDGLHELCSLFEPLALADLIEVSEAEHDEVLCPGVEGENLADAGAGGAARARLGAARRCGSRSRSGFRWPPASAAAAPTPRRSFASPPGRSTDLQGLAAGLGADVPSQLDAGARRWSRGAGERVEPLPGRRRTPPCCSPTAAGSAPPPSSPRPIGSGSAATGRGAGGAGRRACATSAGAGASPLSYPELLVNDLEAAGALAAAAIGDALDALRVAGAPVALLSGSGPTAFGLFEDLAAARAAAEAHRPRRRDRLRGRERRREDCRREGGEQPQTPADRDRRRGDRRRLLPAQPAARQPRPAAPAGRHLRTRLGPGPTCSSESSPSPRPAPSSASSSPARP